jgi:hypothetical protein
MENERCPKCGHERDANSIECSRCGIIFSRYYAFQQKVANQRRCHEVEYIAVVKKTFRYPNVCFYNRLYRNSLFRNFIMESGIFIHTCGANHPIN